jgi:hypothetical protein
MNAPGSSCSLGLKLGMSLTFDLEPWLTLPLTFRFIPFALRVLIGIQGTSVSIQISDLAFSPR